MWTILGNLGLKLGTYWAANSSKVIVMGVVTVTTLGILAYGYHKVDQGGYDRAESEWQDKEAKINRVQGELLKLKQHEYQIAVEKNSNAYFGAWKQYVEINEAANRDRAKLGDSRMFVRATCPKGSGNTMPTDAKVSSGDIQAGNGNDWAELGSEDSKAVQETTIDVRQMSDQFRSLLEKMNKAGMFE